MAGAVKGKQRIAVAWSSGKDSAWMLSGLLRDADLEVAALLTTVREDDRSIAIHETPGALLQAQVDAIGLPLYEISLPWPCPNAEYEKRLTDAAFRLLADGITGLAFGDLFLEDIREYRERLFAPTGLDLLFPLWGLDTARLAQDMLSGGIEATVCSVMNDALAEKFLGRNFDDGFLQDLPPGVDPCGENGEFHTIVTNAPCFATPISLKLGEMESDAHHTWLRMTAAQ